MDIETIRDYCIRKKGTTEEFPFDNVTLVFKVMGKMYACIGLDNPEWLSLNKEKTMAEGANPKVMSSANESNSFPKGPDTLNKRANMPSKKSNTALYFIPKQSPPPVSSFYLWR
jgi:hypothetical protein